jgi:hypothetical protein
VTQLWFKAGSRLIFSKYIRLRGGLAAVDMSVFAYGVAAVNGIMQACAAMSEAAVAVLWRPCRPQCGADHGRRLMDSSLPRFLKFVLD